MDLSSYFPFNKPQDGNDDNYLQRGLMSKFPVTMQSPTSTASVTAITANGQTTYNSFKAEEQAQQESYLDSSANEPTHNVIPSVVVPVTPAMPISSSTAMKVDTEEPDIPRGVLKVTIIRAHGLKVSASSKPYVVCTYEAAESITGAARENEHIDANDGKYQNMIQPKLISQRPIYARQSSNRFLRTSSSSTNIDTSNPKWMHPASFDVTSPGSKLEICVYDSSVDILLGKVEIQPITLSTQKFTNWYDLNSGNEFEPSHGKIEIEYQFNPVNKRHYGPEDFQIIKMLGKGTFGEVFQVRKKDSHRIYAMKVLDKKYIAKKKEIAHTFGERNILIVAKKSPFIVPLKFTFQTPSELYFIFDYMAGGELFFHLQNERKFGEERTKFYIAELVCALEHLHNQGVIYRDLKPENILLDSNGHIALCDFGLSKLSLTNDDTAKTFCGTTEYLAPEILLDENGYNKMVDFWSLGVLIFEMCCGWSPFYADTVQQMYKNIAYGKVKFPKDALSPDGRSFVKGLLNRNPNHRLGSNGDAAELKAHKFFSDINWDSLVQKKIPPPFRPHVSNELDTSNFDPEFTQNLGAGLSHKHRNASTPLSPGLQANFNGFTYVDPQMMDNENYVGTYKKSVYKGPGSLIAGNPLLPADENVIEDDEEMIDVDEESMRSPEVEDYDVDLV